MESVVDLPQDTIEEEKQEKNSLLTIIKGFITSVFLSFSINPSIGPLELDDIDNYMFVISITISLLYWSSVQI